MQRPIVKKYSKQDLESMSADELQDIRDNLSKNKVSTIRNLRPAGFAIDSSLLSKNINKTQKENLNEIRVRITTRALKINGGLVLHLTLAKNPEMDLITSTRLFKDTVIEEWMAFKFPPIQDSKGKNFYFYLTTLDGSDVKPVRLGRFEEDNYKQGQLMLNGRPQKGDLSFVALNKNDY